jgi:hypothetical protein
MPAATSTPTTASPAPAAAAAAPAAPAAAPAAPPPVAPAVPSPAAPAASGVGAPLDLGRSVVHVTADRSGTWLESRSTLYDGEWTRLCPAPCDRELVVEGNLLRLTAPGMTTSNAFRIEPGRGIAFVKVKGGSAKSRRIGIITLAAGVPVALLGMGLYGYARLRKESGMEAAGAVVLGAGAVSIGVSLPLLLFGSTDVKNGKGSLIARMLSATPTL